MFHNRQCSLTDKARTEGCVAERQAYESSQASRLAHCVCCVGADTGSPKDFPAGRTLSTPTVRFQSVGHSTAGGGDLLATRYAPKVEGFIVEPLQENPERLGIQPFRGGRQ